MGLIESKSQLVVLTKQWSQGSGSIAITGSTLYSLPFDTQFTTQLFVADRPYQVVSVVERHSVLGSTPVMLVGALGSTPLGSGTPLLASTIPTFSTVNIPNFGTLFGSAVLSGSTAFGTTAVGPILGSGDALGVAYGSAGLLQPVGSIQVILQTV